MKKIKVLRIPGKNPIENYFFVTVLSVQFLYYGEYTLTTVEYKYKNDD